MAVFDLTEAELRRRTSLKWQTHPDDVLPLWVAEMDVRQSPAVIRAVVEAMEAGDTGYPAGTVFADAYAAMAQERWGWRPGPEQLQRTGDVMNALLGLLLGNTGEGDRVVINPPVYPPFWQVVEGYRRRLVQVPLTASGRLDLAGLAAAFAAERPAAYLVCSPHNPTGTVHTPEELAAVADLCAEHDVMLFVDEIHAVLVDPGTAFTPILALPQAQRAVVAFSAGKGWNLAAFKGGLYIAGTQAHDLVDRVPPFTKQAAGHLATIAHTAALRDAPGFPDDVMAEVARNKDLLGDLLAEQMPAVRYDRAPGTYLAWLDCTRLSLPNPQLHFLARARVGLNDGSSFGPAYGQFVRMNLAASPALITQAVERMAASVR